MPVFTALRPIILASQSPRRKDLLASLGLEFTIHQAKSELVAMDGVDPIKYALACAKGKAIEVKEELGFHATNSVIIAADTIVCLDNIIYGKPLNKANAFDMLKKLQGNTHEVITGCCIYIVNSDGLSDSLIAFHEVSQVTMGTFNDKVITNYINTLEPMDKAGSYALQGLGSFIVTGIKGSWTNVVGLPTSLLCNRLLENNCIAPA